MSRSENLDRNQLSIPINLSEQDARRLRRGLGEDALATGPCSTTRPCSSTATFAQIFCTTSMEWVITTRVTPVSRLMSRAVEDRVGALGVECRRGLVTEDDLGFAGERAGDRHALLLAAGQLAGIAGCLLRKADARKQAEGALARSPP